MLLNLCVKMENTEFEDNVLFPISISLKSVISILPIPTILINLQGDIYYANLHALSFFLSPNETDFYQNRNICHLFVDLVHLESLINDVNETNANVEKNLLIRRFDNSVVSATVFAKYFKSDFQGIILQFIPVSSKTNAFVSEKLRNIRNDITLLKPYLNKPGKEILEKIITNNLSENISSYYLTSKNHLNIIPSTTFEKISQLFPEFTNSELNLCSLLSMKLSIEEIAAITGKTSNSIRVSFHRLLKKTDLQNGKELLRKLETC